MASATNVIVNPITPGPVTVGPPVTVKLTPPPVPYTFPNYINTPKDIINKTAGVGSSARTGSAGAPSAAKTRQISIAAAGNPIRVTYGRDRIGADITDFFVWSYRLVLMCVWGHGPYQDIEKVYVGGKAFTGTMRHYMGANTEAIDPVLATRPKYLFNPIGKCFSVLELSSGFVDSVPSLEVTAIVQGRKDIYDPRTGTTGYSENAALILGHFLDTYFDRTVHEDDLATCADVSDETLDTLTGNSKKDRGRYRHRLGVTFDQIQAKERYVATLKEYARVFTSYEGGVIRMIPHKDGVSAASIGIDQIVKGSDSKGIPSLSKRPNVVTTFWTNTENDDEWIDTPFSTPFPTSEPVREQVVHMPGMQTLALVQRWTTERRNLYITNALEGKFRTRDEGLLYLCGDLVDLTDGDGLENKQVRLLNIEATSTKGEWAIEWAEHDPSAYVETYVDGPSVTDFNLANPNDIPAGPTTTVAERAYDDQLGHVYSRFEISFPASSWPYVKAYRIKVSNGAEIILDQTQLKTLATTYVIPTGPLTQGVNYRIDVWIINIFGNQGTTPDTKFQTALGKLLRPAAPTAFTVFEAGGTCYYKWVTGFDLDRRGDEIRYGSVGTAWADMTIVNRWTGFEGQSSLIPVGTWDFEIRTFDSVRTAAEPFGQYSASGLRRTLKVDNDSAAFHIDDYEMAYDASASSGLIEVDGIYYTDAGDSWDDMFGSNPMSDFPNPVAEYVSDQASEWVSEITDFGSALSMTLQLSTDVYALVGDVDIIIEHRPDGVSSWTQDHATSVKATIQQFRVRFETAAAERLVVPPLYGFVTADVIPVERRGAFTTDGVNPTTIDIGVEFQVFTYISVSCPRGSGGENYQAVFEDVHVGDPSGFDAYILDGSSQVAHNGYWIANGY